MASTSLLEKINALPDNLKIQVEHYVEFLLTKCTNSDESTSEQPKNLTKKRDGFGILKGKIVMLDDIENSPECEDGDRHPFDHP